MINPRDAFSATFLLVNPNSRVSFAGCTFLLIFVSIRWKTAERGGIPLSIICTATVKDDDTFKSADGLVSNKWLVLDICQ